MTDTTLLPLQARFQMPDGPNATMFVPPPPSPEAIARAACSDRILMFYPIHKQLNILASGDSQEIERMRRFIDACRAWSNSDNPQPEALAAIEP
ncbi:MAG: hypothetical protein N2690_05850 [Rhodocyclaceae bacterium]|nr:hypothetical protein [Rhodocyclaceae bacterium]